MPIESIYKMRQPLKRQAQHNSVFSSLAIGIGLFLSAAFPSSANWKEELGVFRIAVVMKDNVSDKMAKIEPFRLAVTEKLGVPVEIIPTRDLQTLIRNHSEGRSEYAILSASAYGAVWSLCECVEALAVASSADGSIASNSVLIARNDGSVTTPQSLAGKRIIALGKDSVLGYAFPVFELKKQNIDLVRSGTEFLFFETAEEAVTAFANGEGDALIGWSANGADANSDTQRGTLGLLAKLDPSLSGKLKIVWNSSAIPHRVHSIRKNLDAEPKQIMRELLESLFDGDPVAYDAIESDYSGGFRVIGQDALSDIIEFVSAPMPGTKKLPESDDEELKDARSTGKAQ